MGFIIDDWSKVNLHDRDQQKMVIGAIQHFCSAPETPEVRQILASAQYYTTKGDFPAEVNAVIERFKLEKSLDEGWRNIFDVIDFTGTKESGFDLYDVDDGIVFRKIGVGDKIRMEKVFGSKVSVSFDRYGGGLEYDQTWFDDSKFWAIEDNTRSFRNKHFDKRSQIFYNLIDAVPAAQDLAWEAVTPSNVANTNENYDAIRDANTINKACELILLDLKDSGLDVTAESQFILLAPIQLIGRIRRAMGVLNAGISAGLPALSYNVTPQFTLRLTDSAKYYVCLPGRKNKAGIRQELTILADFDILAYTNQIAGWARYGGAIGETNQFQRCATA